MIEFLCSFFFFFFDICRNILESKFLGFISSVPTALQRLLKPQILKILIIMLNLVLPEIRALVLFLFEDFVSWLDSCYFFVVIVSNSMPIFMVCLRFTY